MEYDYRTCHNAYLVLLGGSVPHIFIDVAMLLLPNDLVWNLHMKLPQKIMLCGVSTLGGL